MPCIFSHRTLAIFRYKIKKDIRDLSKIKIPVFAEEPKGRRVEKFVVPTSE
jgi:biotin operon repressor